MVEVNEIWKTFKLSRQQKKEQGPDEKRDTIDAVAGVSFECKPGRVFTLLGPNGAGKTTALRMMATLLKPTKGSIKIAGLDSVTNAIDARKKIGFLTGSTNLYDRLNPAEIVKYYADLHGMPSDKFEKRKTELFETLGIESFAKRRIAKLSTGMKQKVSIARALIHDPEIVIFDEPTAGLDVITAKHIIDLIERLREQNKTIVFSTHIMGEVNLLSDDLAIIHEGRLCWKGEYQQFREQKQGASLEEEFIRIVEEAEV